MADRRVNDLSYGHIGEASYESEEQTWYFSRSLDIGQSIQPIQPLKECIPPSTKPPAQSIGKLQHNSSAEKRWVRKNAWETEPAISLLPLIGRATGSKTSGMDSKPSALLAVGKATDVDHMSGSRDVHIIAIPHGESGNILRLIKPRVDHLGWKGHAGIRLRVLNATSSEDGYWIGDGSIIQQISFATDIYGTTSWLALRKESSTTILRPLFHRVALPSETSTSPLNHFPPSRINPNAILNLSTERTGHRPHADVSFNPWYIRQFAVIDQGGYWSIWDIEGQKRKRTTFQAKQGRSGHIHDGSLDNESLISKYEADGWARVIWAGVSTLVVCDRRHISVFALKVTAKRLSSPELIKPGSTSWILEAKRNPVKLDQVFVLTTSHIYWLQVTSAAENGNDVDYAGAKIILSHRHYRDGEDETVKLELLGQEDHCVVFLYSAKSLVVNTYRFGMTSEMELTPNCSTGSFILRLDTEERKSHRKLQMLSVIPAEILQNPRFELTGPGSQYLEKEIQFNQMFCLDPDLSLLHTLGATPLPSISGARGDVHSVVQAPTVRTTPFSNILSSRLVGDDFIVPDGMEDLDIVSPRSKRRRFVTKSSALTTQQSRSPSIDARRIFDLAFPHGNSQNGTETPTPGTVADYVERLTQGVTNRLEIEMQGSNTGCDLANYTSFSGDIDEASSVFIEILDQLHNREGDGGRLFAVVSNVAQPVFSGKLSAFQEDISPELSEIYDRLVELWVSCLPLETPGIVRLSKERQVRTIATELFLSSKIISIRERSARVLEPREFEDITLPVRGKLQSMVSNSTLIQPMSSQPTHAVSSTASRGLPTPDQTPPVASTDSSIAVERSGEDGVISRLRDYAISIKTQSALGHVKSSILAHWPSRPGSDPLKYSWEDMRKATATEEVDSDDEEAERKRRDQEKRRRRTEKFLARERDKTMGLMSQPIVAPTMGFGSQPPVAFAPKFGSDPLGQPSSSQAVEDFPMTQPDRGLFGSRKGAQKAKGRGRKKGF